MLAKRFTNFISKTKKRHTSNENEHHKKHIIDEFDYSYYVEKYSSILTDDCDPVDHFISTGWKDGCNPNVYFDCHEYLRRNIDVAISGENPFLHYILHGRSEGRMAPLPNDDCTNTSLIDATKIVQNHIFPTSLEKSENIIVILIPEHATMSGGIYSFFSIAKTMQNLCQHHNYEILVMTRPNKSHETYIRQCNFTNSQNVYRFDQITRCKEVKRLYIHIPEYAASDFIDNLDEKTRIYLETRDELYINILNQKIDIMPEPEKLSKLRDFCTDLTQSVAHHAYFGQSFADHYNTPLLLLPAYTDLSNYPATPLKEKKNLIIYSPDQSDWKSEALDIIRDKLPRYDLVEIKDITFDEYMKLATKCKYSITFGEGFDGYLAQPIYQGGVGFSVYNNDFFPSPEMKSFANIFESKQDFLNRIVSVINHLDQDDDAYIAVNEKMMSIYNRLYSKSDYTNRIMKLIDRQFDLSPKKQEFNRLT